MYEYCRVLYLQYIHVEGTLSMYAISASKEEDEGSFFSFLPQTPIISARMLVGYTMQVQYSE